MSSPRRDKVRRQMPEPTPASMTKTEAAFRLVARGDRGRSLPAGRAPARRPPDAGPRHEPHPDSRGAAPAPGRGHGRAPRPPRDGRRRVLARERRGGLPPARRARADGHRARRRARRRPEQVAAIRAHHDALVAAVRDDRSTDVAELNAEWHGAIYAACGSRHLEDFIARLWQAIPVRAIWLTRRASRSLEQHEAIMAAIERGDAAAARDAMRAHIELGASSTVEHLRTLGRGRAMTDALHSRHRRARRPRAAVGRGADPGGAGADRRAAAQPERLHHRHRRPGARRRPARGRPPRPRRGPRAAGRAAGRAEGQHRPGRRARHPRVGLLPRPRPRTRRRGGPPAARRRRHRRRQGAAARVRLRRHHEQPALRPLPQPLGPRARARRLQRRLRRRRRRRPVPGRAGHRHRRLGAHPGRPERRQRPAPDLRLGQQPRRLPDQRLAGHRRADRPVDRGRRARVRRHRRLRPPRPVGDRAPARRSAGRARRRRPRAADRAADDVLLRRRRALDRR